MPTPANLNDLINSTAAAHGIDPVWLASIAKTESGFNVNARSYTGVQGMMQITGDTWAGIASDLSPTPLTDPASQLEAGARLLANYKARYPDERLVYLAYNAGQGTADETQRLIQQGYTYDAATSVALQDKFPNNPRKWAEAAAYPYKVLQNQNRAGTFPQASLPTQILAGASGAGTGVGTSPSFGVDDSSVPQAVNITGETVDPTTLESLEPMIVVTDGLDEVPWFSDPNLITGNPPIRRFIAPISFQIRLGEVGNTLLSDSNGQPLTLELNASLTRFEMASGHVVNKSPSRTGLHLTFWGQKADMISGTASTGAFMNQLGLTHFLSLAQAPADASDLILSAFAGNPVAAQGALANGGLRVAAQDAFVEFLSLFKMNGNFYFRNQNYFNPDFSGAVDSDQQVMPTAWSPRAGSSNFQMNARNNDVMTRGYVVLNMKNNTYLGYFKSLSWAMEADKPFQWTFNFVFQVERTLSLMYYPQQVQQQLADQALQPSDGPTTNDPALQNPLNPNFTGEDIQNV